MPKTMTTPTLGTASMPVAKTHEDRYSGVVDDKTAKILTDALQNPGRYGVTGCALCKGPFTVTALFEPTGPFAKRIGQPKGKKRLLVYGLCQSCSELPNVADRVEEEMLRVMTTH